MATNDVFASDRKPWVRRSFPFQRTHLSDHSEKVFLLFLALAAVAVIGLLMLERVG